MANRQDIQLSANSIIITNNDVVWNTSDDQHIEDTINAFPGWWKENPFDGVGVFAYYKSKGIEQLLGKNVKLQLQADGYSVGNVSIEKNGDKLIINANASR